MKNKILIISTGGTFNKVYDPLSGELFIDKNSHALQNLAVSWRYELEILNTISKDSLDINKEDRKSLVKTIKKSNYQKIIIIHGTDTMDITAKYLAKHIQNKQIILTGAMIPYSINRVEATANLASAYGYLLHLKANGVYIAMNGVIDEHHKVTKDRKYGKFTLK
ncbi:asparaginase [hydrothermal vent metagenome]|uniref:Asparaginase n=1 Tax=hydrothermal vent metagenome TaxID=652676 RepID=A0A1W1CZB4_9ZZZZ